MTGALHITTGVLPVLMLLASLILMDSYKLVPAARVLGSLTVGALAAIGCMYANAALLGATGMRTEVFIRYVGPCVEELAKALFVAHLIHHHKVGFEVDAAIHGFAVGTGFAVVENIYYFNALQSTGLLLWLVRGFGTAMLHGSVTAVFGIVSKGLVDRHGFRSIYWYVPGLVAAIVLHSAFNHFVLPPLASTALLLAILPLVVIIVFQRSERATRNWLGTGFDAHIELIEMIESHRFSETRIGRYLQSLKSSFPGTVVADMFCLLQIHHELAVRAKGTLMARQSGFEIPIDEEVKARVEEMRYLEESIGPTGKLALAPFMATTSRELWQLYILGKK